MDPEDNVRFKPLSREEQLKLWKLNKERKLQRDSTQGVKSSPLKKRPAFSSPPLETSGTDKRTKDLQVIPELKESRKLLNEVSMPESVSGKLGGEINYFQDRFKSFRTEFESLQNTEMLIKRQSDQFLKLQEQANEKAAAIVAKKNELLDKIGILINDMTQILTPQSSESQTVNETPNKEILLEPSQNLQEQSKSERVDAQIQTEFEFESELRKASKCIAAYTMVNCANNIMHQKIVEQEAKFTKEQEIYLKQEGIYKEKISALESKNQLLEAELEKHRLQLIQLQGEIQRHHQSPNCKSKAL